MENQQTETIHTENKSSEITPQVFLNELSGMFTTVDAETTNVSKLLKQKAEGLKRKFYKRMQPYLLSILMAFAHSPHLDNPAFENIESAQMQMQRNGITDDQRKAYIPGVSELLHRGIEPYSYEIDWAIADFIPNVVHGRGSESQPYRKQFNDLQINSREDAWRLYLGLPKKNNTFGISRYRPAKSAEDKYYYKLNHFLEGYTLGRGFQKEDVVKNPIKFILKHIEQLKGSPGGAYDGEANSVMGTYKLDKGEDADGFYVSYYDKWDLDFEYISRIGGTITNVIGREFEIYDRIYYNPQTLEIIENPSIPQGTINKTK